MSVIYRLINFWTMQGRWIQEGFSVEPPRNDSGGEFSVKCFGSGPKARVTGWKSELRTKSPSCSRPPESEPNRPEKGPKSTSSKSLAGNVGGADCTWQPLNGHWRMVEKRRRGTSILFTLLRLFSFVLFSLVCACFCTFSLTSTIVL